MWLADRLRAGSSATAIAGAVSRQEARATRLPRQRWMVHLRRRGEAATALRVQFKAAMKAAHAVRGHLRTDYRTGDKSIKVRPHIRGLGGAVQLKDYLVHDNGGDSID